MATFAAFLIDDLLVAGRDWLPARTELMCRVYWRYVNLDGTPVVERRTFFANQFNPPLHGIDGVMGSYAEELTDANGEGSILLYRDTECEVIIDQTNIVRDITIPDQATANLFTLVGESPDLFEVQRAQPAQPIRRSI
jgi:hypothetical protein